MNKTTADFAASGAAVIRPDQQVIADLVDSGSRVLDVGCGDGELLYYLVHEKSVDGRGIELSRDGVTACFHRGLSVIQGDAEADLKEYPSASFDYVILSQTLQTIHNIDRVIDELLRIGKRSVVSFPNFGHWQVRWRLLSGGRAPATDALPYAWYNSPNIRIVSILDFLEYCQTAGVVVDQMIGLSVTGDPVGRQTSPKPGFAAKIANLRAAQGLFLISSS